MVNCTHVFVRHHLKHINVNDENIIFSLLIFFAANLFISTIYSIYRENYALNPDYLKHIRNILLATTLLQVLCFSGYWLGVYAMYRVATFTWYTLITFALMLMALRFGESYIILVSENYTLRTQNQIPFKYVITIFLVWVFGGCINLIGYVTGFVEVCNITDESNSTPAYNKNISIRSACYVAWDVSCLIILVIGIYVLNSIENRFKRILKDKLEYKEDRKQSRLKKKLLRKQNNNQRSQKKNKIYKLSLTSKTINAEHADEQKYDTHSKHTHSILNYASKTTVSALSTMIETSKTNTTGSINDSYSILTQRGVIMQSELKRMTILMYGLFLIFFIFLFNTIEDVYVLVNNIMDLHKLQNVPLMKAISVEDPRHVEIWAIAYVYIKWTIMNMFIMCFAWIPGSQMSPKWFD